MSYRPPTARYDRFSSLLRRGLDPRFTVEEREHALRALAGSTEELSELVDDLDFRGLIKALNAPYQVQGAAEEDTESSQSLETRCGLGTYNIAADLRQLINTSSFELSWHAVPPEIEDQIRASDRAMVCARAVSAGDSMPGDDLVRGVAWTELVPGAGLLAIRQAWPEDVTRLATYLHYSLDRGASQSSIPLPLASAITAELASRLEQQLWFDQVVAWMEAWVATVPLTARTTTELTRLLRRTRLMMRLEMAMRASDGDVRAPRLFALAELASAVTLIRAAGRADLVRAHAEAGGDPRATARTYEQYDRRADLLFETALGAVLRGPRPEELAALSEGELRALSFMGTLLTADRGLSQGVLPTPN